jgi:hypothetical protein
MLFGQKPFDRQTFGRLEQLLLHFFNKSLICVDEMSVRQVDFNQKA